ncbi:MAG: PKD domain-containing protein [Bacteroidia bacterium]
MPTGTQQSQRIVVRSKGLLAGNYLAALPVETNHPDSATAWLYLQLELVDEPCALIAYDPMDVCDGLVRFEAVGRQPGDEQHWYFDGRDTLTGQVVDYPFPVSGPHEVMLVTSKDGVSDTLRISVMIPSPLVADFSYSGLMLAGEPVNFVADSTAPARFMWDFGDGSSGVFAQKTHTYISQGQYMVSLTVEDSLGCVADTSEVVAINFGVANDALGENLKLEVYPNPFEDNIWLRWEGFAGKAVVTVFDVHGRKVKAFGTKAKGDALDVSDLAEGVYMLKVRLGEREILRRIVKH